MDGNVPLDQVPDGLQGVGHRRIRAIDALRPMPVARDPERSEPGCPRERPAPGAATTTSAALVVRPRVFVKSRAQPERPSRSADQRGIQVEQSRWLHTRQCMWRPRLTVPPVRVSCCGSHLRERPGQLKVPLSGLSGQAPLGLPSVNTATQRAQALDTALGCCATRTRRRLPSDAPVASTRFRLRSRRQGVQMSGAIHPYTCCDRFDYCGYFDEEVAPTTTTSQHPSRTVTMTANPVAAPTTTGSHAVTPARCRAEGSGLSLAPTHCI